MKTIRTIGLLLSASVAVMGCSGADTVQHTTGAGHGGAGGTDSENSGGGGSEAEAGAGGSGAGTIIGTAGSDNNEGGAGGISNKCAGSASEAEFAPLDMFIMLDQSKSMDEDVGGQSRWTA